MKDWKLADRLAVCAAVALGSGCAGTVPEPGGANTVMARLETSGAIASAAEVDRARGAAILQDIAAIERGHAVGDAAADINQRPIRIWAVKGSGGGVEDIYVLGHADGACCPLVSGPLDSAARNPALAGAWFSFGVGLFHASGDAGRRAALGSLVEEIDTISKKPACSGQVTITELEADRIAASSAQLQTTAGELLGRARSIERPIMLWHGLDDGLPRIVPATVAGGPLEVRLPLADLAIPVELIKGLTVDGTASYIAEIRARMGKLAKLAQVQDEVRKLDGGVSFQVYPQGFETNFRGKIEAIILDALARTNTYVTRWKAVERIHEAIGLRDGRSAAALAELKKVRLSCEAALARAQALPAAATSNQGTRIEFLDVVPSGSENPYAFVLAFDAAGQQAELQAKLDEALARPPQAPSNPVPILVDAFLRGWPVTFPDAKLVKRYDAWVEAHQRRVWGDVCAKAASHGVRLGSCKRGEASALQLSNVMFQVTAKRGAVVLRPSFVLAGPTLQVADPVAGLVRYESTLADQNLRHIQDRDAQKGTLR